MQTKTISFTFYFLLKNIERWLSNIIKNSNCSQHSTRHLWFIRKKMKFFHIVYLKQPITSIIFFFLLSGDSYLKIQWTFFTLLFCTQNPCSMLHFAISSHCQKNKLTKVRLLIQMPKLISPPSESKPFSSRNSRPSQAGSTGEPLRSASDLGPN